MLSYRPRHWTQDYTLPIVHDHPCRARTSRVPVATLPLLVCGHHHHQMVVLALVVLQTCNLLVFHLSAKYSTEGADDSLLAFKLL